MFRSWQRLWGKILTAAVSPAPRCPIRKLTARLELAILEDRFVPSTITVTNTHDSGTGSLRQAIISSNAHPGVGGPNLIDFSLPSNSNGEIVPSTPLPAITSPVDIEGSALDPLVLIGNGTTNENGLTINASGCTISNLDIGGWLGDGILINSSNNVIQGDSIGMLGGPDPNGTGIVITGNSNTIGGTTAADANVIALNRYSGIVIDNGQENQVQGNFIGNGVLSNSQVPNPPSLGNTIDGESQGNGLDGVKIEGAAAQDNIVGGLAAGTGNVISGNAADGVAIITDATANIVVGNFIGTNLGGTAVPTDMGNHGDGLYIGSGAHGNFIGDTTSTIEGHNLGLGNVISGNGSYGVEITGAGTELNTLISNEIGTTKTGTNALPNGNAGVLIHGGATDNFLGSSAAIVGVNLISGNLGDGVILSGMGTTGNLVINNIINTNLNGTAALSNHGYGVFIEAGASRNTVGIPGAGNVISGDTNFAGVYIVDAGTKGNMVEANLIGVNAADTTKMSDYIGVAIARSATDNTIGGTTAGAGNVISGNAQQGVLITDAGTTGNMIEGNQIGTNQAGGMALANGDSGVAILKAASGNTVGGTPTGAGNTISGNGGDGVDVNGAGTDKNTVEWNLIGTNSLGTSALGNNYGVVIGGGADNNTVGEGNIISGNTLDGVLLANPGTTGNEVGNNLIGLNAAGNAALPNGTNGVTIDLGAFSNGVDNNFISGNTDDGIHISGAKTEDNGIHRNFIGLATDETTPLPNSSGIVIDSGSNDNVIGGSNNGNIIADNTHAGIAVVGNTSVGNTISQNSIFGNGGLGIDLGNTGTPTTNPTGGFHVGPNDLLNYPVLTASTAVGIVNVSLNSTPLTVFTIEFFSSSTSTPGQGKNYLGSVSVKTDKFGNASFLYPFTSTAANPYLTATATDSTIENTSEFSAPLELISTTNLTPTAAGNFDLNAIIAALTAENMAFSVTITDVPAGKSPGKYQVMVTMMKPTGESVTVYNPYLLLPAVDNTQPANS